MDISGTISLPGLAEKLEEIHSELREVRAVLRVALQIVPLKNTTAGAAPAGARPREEAQAHTGHATGEGSAADAPRAPVAPQADGEPLAPSGLPVETLAAPDDAPAAQSRWTEERKALIRRDWHLPIGEITDRANALPGAPVTKSLVSAYGLAGLKLPKRTPAGLAKTEARAALYDGYGALTQERQDRLHELFADRHEADSIAAMLSRLPGRPVTASMVRAFIEARKLVAPPPPVRAVVSDVSPIAAWSAPKPAPTPLPPALPLWSDARTEELVRRYVRGDAVDAIIADLNRMPGPLLTRNDVLRRAAAKNLKSPIAPVPVGPIITDFETVRAWAAVRGITCNQVSDLAAVNAKARSLGLRPFELEAASRRRA